MGYWPAVPLSPDSAAHPKFKQREERRMGLLLQPYEIGGRTALLVIPRLRINHASRQTR